MKLPTTLKRVPRWAWYTTGGILVGTFAIKMFQNRTTADEAEAAATTDDGTGTVTYGGTYGSAGVIVPPVIAPASDGDGGAFGIDLASLFIGGVTDIFAAVGDVYSHVYDPIAAENIDLTGGLMTTNSETIGAVIDIIANAGSFPVGGTTQASATAQPVPTGGSSAPSTAQKKTCKELYPNFPKHAGAKGQPSPRSCYREACQEGKDKRKFVHRLYKNGDNDRTSEKCGG